MDELDKLLCLLPARNIAAIADLYNTRLVAQHLVALANLEGGGILLVGVRPMANDVVAEGIQPERIDLLTRTLTQLKRQRIAPDLRLEIEPATIAEKTVLYVSVPGQAADAPYHLKGRSSTPTTFVRCPQTFDTRKALAHERQQLEVTLAQRAAGRRRRERWATRRFHWEMRLYLALLLGLLGIYVPFARAFAQFDDRRVTSGTAVRWQGTFSPDGQRIVWEEERNPSTSHLIEMDLQSGHRRDLTPNLPPGTQIASPSFNPDGSVLVVTQGDQHQRDLYLYRSNGTLVRRLTNFDCYVHDPVYESQGVSMLFFLQCGAHPASYSATTLPPTPFRSLRLPIVCVRVPGRPN